MAKKTQPKSSKKSEVNVAEQTLKRFKDSWDYASSHWHAKWDRDGKLYDGERFHRSYEGITDTFVPMVFPTIETMVSELAGANLRFDFKSGNPASKASAAPLNALIDEWWDEEGWELAEEEGIREMLKKGMCAFKWSWESDRPKLDWFSMRDAILDPTVVRMRELQEPGAYAGRRYYVRKGSLESFEVVDTDPESKTYGQMVKRFRNLDNDSKSGEREDDKAKKEEMFGGSTLNDASEHQDEIIEIWDVDRVVTLRNRKDVIEDVENPYKERHRQLLVKRYLEENQSATDKSGAPRFASDEEALADAETRAKTDAKGVVPYFYFRNYRDISLAYAKSEIESVAKEQERLNDMTNMEGDYIIKQLAMQRELDPAYADFLPLINNYPDTVYPFKPGSLQNIPSPVLPANSFANRQDIKNTIREATAIGPAAKGAENQGNKTATEVNEVAMGTSKRIESKARILEKDGLYWMSWILFKLVQLYVDKPMVVEVSGAAAVTSKDVTRLPNGTTVAVFDPADYQEDWRPSISLELDQQSRKNRDQQEARTGYQIMIQDPTNNLPELKKRFYPKMFDLDKEDIDAILTPPEAQPGMGSELPPELGAEGAPEAPMAAPIEVPNV